MKMRYLWLALLLASQPALTQEPHPAPVDSAGAEKKANEKPLVSFLGLKGTFIEVSHQNIPLVIRYSSDIDPESLSVRMNGEDITDRFDPTARYEAVQIQLAPGTNTIEVTAKPLGAEAEGQTHTLTMVRRDKPAMQLRGNVQRGKFDSSDSKKSVEEILREISNNRQ